MNGNEEILKYCDVNPDLDVAWYDPIKYSIGKIISSFIYTKDSKFPLQ